MTVTDLDGRRGPIMLSAGEASGDVHGATLCRGLRALEPEVRLLGMGGAQMRAAGMDVLLDPTAHAAVGTSEAIGRIPALYRAYRALGARLAAERPRALVLIDFPEFNLRLARRARALGVPVAATHKSFEKLSSITMEEGVPKATDMVRSLVKGHEAVAKTAREVFAIADKADDQPTADMLTERMQVHEKTAWMLRSLLE